MLSAFFLLEAPAQVGLGPFHRLIEQIPEPHGVAGAGFELFAVWALHQAEGHVFQRDSCRSPTGPLGHLENGGEMTGLAGIRYINHPAGGIAIGPEPIADGGQVGGGVVEAAIAFLHDQRHRFALLAGHPLQEHTAGPVIGNKQACLIEVIDYGLEPWVVKRLAPFAELDI